MSPSDLLQQCNDQIAQAGPDATVTLFLRGRKSRGESVRLLSRRGPRGQLCSDTGEGLVVGFKAAEVKAFIEKELSGGEGVTA